MSFDIQDGIFVTPWAVFIGRKAYDLTTLQEIKGLTRQNNITARNSFGKLSQHMTSNIGMNLPWVSKYFDVYFSISADTEHQLYMYYIEENQLKQEQVGTKYTFPFYEDEGGIFIFDAQTGSILKIQKADNVYSTDQSEKKYIIRNKRRCSEMKCQPCQREWKTPEKGNPQLVMADITMGHLQGYESIPQKNCQC